MNQSAGGVMRGVGRIAIFAMGVCFAQQASAQRLKFNPALSVPSGTVAGREAALSRLPFRVPKGFTVRRFAQNISHPGMMAAEGGSVYICRPNRGEITELRTRSGVVEAACAASGLNRPQGICLHNSRLYVCADREILAANCVPGSPLAPFEPVLRGLPSAVSDDPDHALAFGPDNFLYFSLSVTADAPGTIQRVRPDGSGLEKFATGLQNTTSFGWNPDNGAMWGIDSSVSAAPKRPEELNRIQAGKDYGAFARESSHENVAFASRFEAPQLLCPAYSGATALAFYTQRAFPADYWNDAFVTMRGDAGKGVAGKVSRIRFRYGKPVGFEDFLTGSPTRKGGAAFCPTGIAVTPDGALLVADDASGSIYRITWNAAP